MSADALLLLDRIELGHRDGSSVLRDLSFGLASGEVLAVLGPNGSGKTTLVRGLMGLMPLRSGDISLGGRSINSLDAIERTALGLVCVPEGRATFPDLTVDETLRLAGRRAPRPERRGRAERVLETFPELSDRRRILAGSLSGGEQQMLSIARALMLGPRVLVLDEPSLGLGRSVVTRLAAALRALVADGLSILITDQDLSLSFALADRALVLDVARPARFVDVDALKTDPALAAIYLDPPTDPTADDGIVVST